MLPGRTPRCLGLHLWRARSDDHFETAIRAHERLEAGPLLARTRYEYARMLLIRGQTPDRDRALGLLDRALATASTLGMATLAEGTRTLLAARADEIGPAAPKAAQAAVPELPKNLFRREGEYWTVSYDGSVVRLRDAKGQLGAGLIDLLLRYQRPRSGHVAWRELVASLAGELDPVQATAGTLEQYRHVDAQVLLMYGSETDPMFVDCAEALHAVLPHSTVLGLPGLNHDSAQTYGKPEMIAASLRLFFVQQMA
jgi:hypothetical protein